MEEWRIIDDYQNYEVSNTGTVRNVETLYELRSKCDKGYDRVMLHNNGQRSLKSIHRLVAEAFIDNPNDKKEVNHIDGNKHNNHVNNLEWVTRSENMLHAYDIGLKHFSGGLAPKKVKITETGKTYDSLHECARDIDGTYSRISDCLNGRRKTHKKYHFESVE